MRKLFYIILVFILVGCSDEKVMSCYEDDHKTFAESTALAQLQHDVDNPEDFTIKVDGYRTEGKVLDSNTIYCSCNVDYTIKNKVLNYRLYYSVQYGEESNYYQWSWDND